MPPKIAPAANHRIDWLDGWRTVAVGIVIASHLAHAYGWDDAPIPGKLGVYIFFAISGYIVTRILIVERDKTGRIDLAGFYRRRALRILPPLVLYLSVVTILFWPNLGTASGALRSLLFTCNMAVGPGDCGWVFGHTWSLGFEEQFYLLMPFALVGIAGWRRGALFTLAAALAFIPFVWPVHFIGRIGFIQIYMLLGLGALYACHETRVDRLLLRIPASLALAGLVFAGLWVMLAPGKVQMLTGLLVAPAVLVGVFAFPKRSATARRCLASRPMRTIGLYSYTLYLWQQLALSHAPWNTGFMPVLALGGALAISALSYHTLETWCRHLAHPKPGRPNYPARRSNSAA